MNLSERKVTTSMISTIHVLKARAFTDDDTYRDFLLNEAGVTSAKNLTIRSAGRVIDRLRELAGEGSPARGAVSGLDSPIGGKLRALWIAGYDLGVVSDRTDRAMLSFLQRQTGVSHTRFLNDPRAATSAIEGLKSWLARAAGVEWPRSSEDVIGSKRAVIEAQIGRLRDVARIEIGGLIHKVTGRFLGQDELSSQQIDGVQNALGRKLREALAKHKEALS